MMLKKTLSASVAVAMLVAMAPSGTAVSDAGSGTLNAVLPYQDTSLSFEERAADLVSRMTLEEKAAQMGRNAPAISRLGLPKYNYWREAIHGVARQGQATSFPSSLAMSNTWDKELMFSAMDITSTEARGKNNRLELSYWNPTINMARDPRWGRNEESYGEDPYLTAQLGGAAVRGMQGDDEKYLKTISTIKHYAANNNENDRQVGTSIMSEKTLREYYTRAFGDITENENPGSVMSSYNGITMTRNGETITDYLASSANPYLLTDVLRRAYGFNGYVVGDCGAWSNLFTRDTLRQKLFPDMKLSEITQAMTTAKAIEAGNNLDCGNDAFLKAIDAVNEGILDEGMVDRAVYELYLERMRTGEFDSGARYQDITADVIEKDEHVEVAEKAAEESWVLLENKDNFLPLKKNVTRVAVVGSFADKLVLGDYSGSPTKTSTPIEGIRNEIEKLNPDAEVQFLSAVPENESLMNIKSLTLVKENGTRVAVDLSKAESVSGAELDGGVLRNVTPKASAMIPNVDFSGTVSIEAEVSTGAMLGGMISIGYGLEGTVATIKSASTPDVDTYTVCAGGFDGQGGYDQTNDLYISAASMPGFSIENYESQLDAADVIIAYAVTIPKEDGLGEPDARESLDRTSIDLPAHESHVEELCAAYPEKTVVAMSTVGQMNVDPFKNSSAAILWTSYNGQAQGEALGKILTGAANPSGRLSTTWYAPADLEKMPNGATRETINGISYRFADYEIVQRDGFPGRTYQYYGGKAAYPFGFGLSYTSFEYSNITADKTSADANDTVTITAEVKNTGSTAGAEVAQLYVTVPGADGRTLPLKQLKGFERVELAPGETKKVSFTVDISDICFFDEATQSEYVINGDHIFKVGKNADDDQALSVTVNVTGQIADEILRVKAIPKAIKVYGASDGTTIRPAIDVKPETTITMKNHKIVTDLASLADVSITYESSNPSAATVEADGTVKAGTAEGTSLITVTAKQGDITVTDCFPVVMQLRDSISADKKADYLAKLDAEYAAYIEKAYSADNWAKLTQIYTAARAAMEAELLEERFDGLLADGVNKMAAVEKLALTVKYTISSDKISGGRINYKTIGAYTADEGSVSGTVTQGEPLVTELNASNNGTAAENVIWSVEKLDASIRKAPEINGNKLTVYENGTFKITAADYDTLECGEMIVRADIQIEGESADNPNGADVTDVKNGASNGGLNAGSTGAAWIRYDGVKLTGITDVTFRVSQKDAESEIKLSTIPGDDGIIAKVKAPVTGAWDKWEEVSSVVNRNELAKVKLDENGCGSVYVQANGANLDYFIFDYINSDMDVLNEAGGKMTVTAPYAGTLIVTQYNEDGSLKSAVTKEIEAAGKVTLEGYEIGDNVKLMLWDGLGSVKPLTNAVEQTYSKPQIKSLTVFNLSDAAYDTYFDSAAGTKLVSGTGLDGIGDWQTQTRTFTVNYSGKDYTFTRGLKGGRGTQTNRCLYFTPGADGLVTVFFEASTDRFITIDQNGRTQDYKGIGDKSIATAEMEVKEGEIVYIYGGGSNKQIYGVFFDTERELTPATPTPGPTATPEPLPEIGEEVTIEAESYTKAWPEPGAKRLSTTAVSAASGGFVVDNTKNNDILYFGEQDITKLEGINAYAGTKEAANKAEFFAVDVSAVNVAAASQADIEALLTPANSLGSVMLVSGKNWNDFNDNIARVVSDKSGRYGIFMKLTTTGSYCGNYDYIKLMYAK